MEDNSNRGNSQCVEDSSYVKFTWKIANFSKLNVEKRYSDAFDSGRNAKWRVMIFPKGNTDAKSLSIYIKVADSQNLPPGWSRFAKINFSVVNETNTEDTITKETSCDFDANAKDWGFNSFMLLETLNDPSNGYLVDDKCTVRVEIWCGGQVEKGEQNITKRAALGMGNSSSFAEFNNLFTDIQNLIKPKTPETNIPIKFSAKEISEAEKLFKECLNMDLTCIVGSGKALELKNSLAIMLATDTLPKNMVDEAAKFLGGFDQIREEYEAAQQDLSDAREDQDLVVELKTELEKLVSKFVPLRSEAEATGREIDWLEKQLADREAKRARIMKSVGDLALQATVSKEELVCAEQKMNLSKIKKEQAEKSINEFNRTWKSVKELHTMNQTGESQT